MGKAKGNRVEIKKEVEDPINTNEFDEDLAALQDDASGKAKKNDEDLVTNTLFVHGVPFNATDKQFEEFFEDIGPLKKCFLVKKGKDETNSEDFTVNKGFGFVTYALKEDGIKAINELVKKEFLGRFLKIELANKKTNKSSDKDEQRNAPKTFKKHINPKPKSNEVESDRSIFISNIPVSMGKARLVKFLDENSIKPQSTYFQTGYARAIYETVELAQMACSKLQNKAADKAIIHASILTNVLLKTRSARLIVRNLPFKYRERDLEKVFEKIGPVIEVNLPRNEQNRLKGFGIIQYPDIKMAEKAIEDLNETEHEGRVIAVDFCVSKNKYTNEAHNEYNNEEISDEEIKDEEIEIKQEDVSTEIFKNSMYEDANPEDDITDSSEDEGEEDRSVKVEEPQDAKGTSARHPKDDKKFNIPAECTLFVRNLLFETQDSDLHEKFSEFGKLHYARVVYDKDTGKSKGTGFVCFVNPKDAKKCLELSKSLDWESESKKNLSNPKSVLIPEISNANAEKFTLQGRLMLISPAVSKETAVNLTTNKKSEKIDKRNYYLLREGVIFPQSEAGKKLSEKELQKRQESYNTRKDQLKANPSLFVSKTRLAIRGLPFEIDDKGLKALAYSAVDKFKTQANSGLRQHLTADERAEGWDKKPAVIQAKIVRSKDKVDKNTNKAKSKGFGFVEFSQHAHALAALRYLNCNPGVFPEKSRMIKGKDNNEVVRGQLLMVEFAIENKVILKRREDRKIQVSKRKLNEIEESEVTKKEETDSKPKLFLNKKKMKQRQVKKGKK